MKYMLLMYWNQSETPELPPEEQQAAAQAWFAYLEEAKAAGVLLDNNGLAPAASATTVRVRDGKTLVIDGPFAETHEQMGGYFVLNCADIDEAIKWAEKIPAAQYGSIEIRPLWSPG
ncbi:MAG: YciI family protein [Chloroflexota bacterium]